MVASEATKAELSDAIDTMLEEVRWSHTPGEEGRLWAGGPGGPDDT